MAKPEVQEMGVQEPTAQVQSVVVDGKSYDIDTAIYALREVKRATIRSIRASAERLDVQKQAKAAGIVARKSEVVKGIAVSCVRSKRAQALALAADDFAAKE